MTIVLHFPSFCISRVFLFYFNFCSSFLCATHLNGLFFLCFVCPTGPGPTPACRVLLFYFSTFACCCAQHAGCTPAFLGLAFNIFKQFVPFVGKIARATTGKKAELTKRGIVPTERTARCIHHPLS